jgi:transcription elongation factor S-II
MPSLSTVLLSIKGDIKKANIQLNDSSELTLDNIQKYFKKKDQPERVCYYEYDEKIIFIFGYKKGKKGTENKVELPPPYDNIVLFGDAIVVVSLTSKWENPIAFSVDQWNSFYNSLMGGDFEKENSDEEDSDDDSDEEDVLSEVEEEKSIKDDYDDENTIDTVDEEEVEEEEEVEQVAVKKKRAPVYAKIDTNALKDDIDRSSESHTNNIRTLCLKTLQFLASDFSEEAIKKLEQSMFEAAFDNSIKNYIPRNWKSPQFVELYRQVVRTVISNIHPNSPVGNPRLLKRVMDGEFELSAIPFMTSYEMFPEKWFALRDKQLQREQKILEGNKSRATDQFKCRRCNKRECTYYEMQTRSADEPMTIFITCLNCGKEWRQGG